MFSDEFNHILILTEKKGLRMSIFFCILEADALERKETFKMRLQISSGGINQANIEVLSW
jgi:hypothetical protein